MSATEIVQRFISDGSSRAGICAHLVESWLACPQNARIEEVLSSLIHLSAESPARLKTIDDAVGGALAHHLTSVPSASHAGNVCAHVAARYLALQPESVALADGLTEALRTMPDAGNVHQAIGKVAMQNPRLVGAHLIPLLIERRVQDLLNGAMQRACRSAVSARCLGDIKALTPFMGQSPYRDAYAQAFGA